MTQASPPEDTTPEAPTANELDRLRDILFGSQSRFTDKRLGDLETRLETARLALAQTMEERVNSLADHTASQAADQRRDLTARLDAQHADHTTLVRQTHKDLSDRLDNAFAELTLQLRQTHKDLSDRLDKQAADQAERLRQAQAEARQRDEALRQEFLNLATSLSDSKTSRADLGQMLIEMGQRLRNA